MRQLFDYCGAISALPGIFSLVTAVQFLNGRKFLFIDCGDSKHACPAPLITRRWLPRFPSETATRHHQNPWGICVCRNQDASRSEIFFKRRHNRLRWNPRQLPALRAEVIGQSVGSDASRLSCFLFRPRKSCEKRRKRSHTNVSSTLSTRSSTPPAQTPHVRFRGRKRVHTPPQPWTAHTAAYTAKHGAFRMGVVSLPSDRSARSQTSPSRVSERHTLPLWGLGRGCSQRTQGASGQRCAYARRCSEGVAAPLGCVIFSVSVEIATCMPCAQGLSVCARRGVVSLPSARFTCCWNAGRPLVKTAHLPFSEVRWA